MSALKRSFVQTLPILEEVVDHPSFYIFVNCFRKSNASHPTQFRDMCADIFPGSQVILGQRTEVGKNERNNVILFVPTGLFDPFGERYKGLSIPKAWKVTYRRELCSPWPMYPKKDDLDSLFPEAKKANLNELGFF